MTDLATRRSTAEATLAFLTGLALLGVLVGSVGPIMWSVFVVHDWSWWQHSQIGHQLWFVGGVSGLVACLLAAFWAFLMESKISRRSRTIGSAVGLMAYVGAWAATTPADIIWLYAPMIMMCAAMATPVFAAAVSGAGSSCGRGEARQIA